MITAGEEEYVLNRAYIPEHTIELITRISGGEPYLIDDYFCSRTQDRVIIVRYPLERDFNVEEFETLIHILTERFRPLYASIIAPDLASSLAASCRERESNHYYTLDIHATNIKSRLQRLVDAALEELTLEHYTDIKDAHRELMKEFVERIKPPLRIRELLSKMPEYVGHTRN